MDQFELIESVSGQRERNDRQLLSLANFSLRKWKAWMLSLESGAQGLGGQRCGLAAEDQP